MSDKLLRVGDSDVVNGKASEETLNNHLSAIGAAFPHLRFVYALLILVSVILAPAPFYVLLLSVWNYSRVRWNGYR
jgi:hypothetical protein